MQYLDVLNVIYRFGEHGRQQIKKSVVMFLVVNLTNSEALHPRKS